MKWLFIQKLKNPLTIIKVEESLNIKFPVSFIECIETNNAGTPENNIFDTEDSKERVVEYLLSFNLDEKDNILDTYRDLKERLPENIIPIANDPFGNYICFNFFKDLKEPKVVYLDLNNQNTEKISNTFFEFIEKLYV